MLTRPSIALLMAAALGGVAQAHEPERPGSEILSQLPTDAPPGECYARVRVPGEPIAAPPVATGARWVMSPGPYGSPGPIWCLVPTGLREQAPIPTMKDGWIRVLCDEDATPDRIRGLQHRLHDRGYYRGSASGRYDAETADAVRSFQSESDIRHGGYLSLDTLDALQAERAYDGQAVYADERYGREDQEGVRGAHSYQSSTSYASSGGHGYPQGYPPAYRPSPQAQQPCCMAAPVHQGGGHGFRGPAPPYASGRGWGGPSAIRNGWLTWNGKTEF